jgi:hypothetical protein
MLTNKVKAKVVGFVLLGHWCGFAFSGYWIM